MSVQVKTFLLCLLCILNFIIFTNCDQSTECFNVYYCCRKEGKDCVEYCDPVIECKESKNPSDKEKNENSQEETTTFGYNEPEGLIIRACRKNYRFVNGKCRKML